MFVWLQARGKRGAQQDTDDKKSNWAEEFAGKNVYIGNYSFVWLYLGLETSYKHSYAALVVNKYAEEFFEEIFFDNILH